MNAAHTAWGCFRADVLAVMRAGSADQFARLTWSAERIKRAQRDALQTLLRHAAEDSPFHRRRLAGIDHAAVDPADLSALPVMTKTQMMDALDDVFTDRRLGRAEIDSALAVTGPEPVPILGDYIALASGGCSGRRGLFVLDRAAVAAFTAAVTRQPVGTPHASDPPRGPPGIAFVAAASAVHATAMISALTCGDDPPVRFDLVPATLPLNEIVKRLNELRPQVLGGYASMLARLAAEARAGCLQITPALVSSTSETLLPEIRSAIRGAFGVPVLDSFGSTEGLVGKTGPDDDVFVFNTDLCIVELVDADNGPVEPGVPSAKVLVTNLYNLTQPLIRYELTDTFIRQPDAIEDGYLRARVRGRSDEVLHYNTIDIHPITIRTVMVKTPQVIDYQVRQTRSGIDVFAITTDPLNLAGLADRLRQALIDGGLTRPDVTVQPVDRLDRHPVTGKLRRFIPITAA
jgi:phenylacetate-CoA ligase